MNSMKQPEHALRGGGSGGQQRKGIVNIRLVKRFKTAMLFVMAPTGLVAIAFATKLRVSERFNIGILWLSAIAVSAYAIEAYELRKSSEAQVDLQRKLMMNEFLPIIVPSGEGFISGGKLELNIINCGKGVAKDIRVRLASATVATTMAILSDGLPVTLVADQNHEKIRAAAKGGEAQEIKLNVLYRDIYEREMSTTGLRFVREGRGKNARYVLHRTGWQYRNPDGDHLARRV
jgi:hypothetical protein